MDRLRWNDCLSLLLGGEACLEQADVVRDWSQSRVLRLQVGTDQGMRTVFAKQAPDGLDLEVEVHRCLAVVPEFPAPAGVHALIGGQEWLLIMQAEGTRLAEAAREQYLSAAGCLAGFHEQAARENWAGAIGLTAALSEQIGRLLVSIPAIVQELVLSGQFTSVDSALLAAVKRMLAAHGASLIRHLDSFPSTLCHGDCHGGNLFIGEAGVQLIDWGSATRAPGLLDLVGLIDVAVRMGNDMGDVTLIIDAYWTSLSEQTRQAYGSRDRAWSVLRVTRALLELEWFARDGDDYGTRANRELGIILDCLASSVPTA